MAIRKSLRAKPKKRGGGLWFTVTVFTVVAVLCVALMGLSKGLILAGAIFVLAVLKALVTRRLNRGVVGVLMDAGDRDFERMRRERVARRKTRGPS